MKIVKSKNINTKSLIVIAALLLAGLVTYFALAYFNHYPPFSLAEETSAPGQAKVNMNRTDTEKQATEALKDDPSLKTQNNQTDKPTSPVDTNSSGKHVVNVLLTNASIINGNVRASGTVTNIVEEGGSCSYVFTNGTTTITKTSKTLVNPSSTTCEAVTFSASELPVNGTWNVVLKYESTDATGVSNTKEFTKDA